MKLKWIKNIDFWGIINEYIKQIGIGIFVLLISILGLPYLFDLKGSPRPELFATINCGSWKAPCCVDKEIEKFVGKTEDIRERLREEDRRIEKLKNGYRTIKDTAALDFKYDNIKYLNKEALKNLEKAIEGVRDPNIVKNTVYKFPKKINKVLDAESMYTIEVINKGDKEASNPILTIENNLYSEVIRRIGKGDKSTPEEHFMPKDIKLGLIQAGKTVAVEVKAWISSQPSRHRAKKIELTCEGRPASLYIETPVRTFARRFNKHFWKTIILTPLALLLFYLFIRRRRRNTIGSNKAEPQQK